MILSFPAQHTLGSFLALWCCTVYAATMVLALGPPSSLPLA